MPIKKHLSLWTTIMLAVTIFAGCSTKNCQHSDFKSLAPNATNGDEYLYEITYEQYDFDKGLQYLNANKDNIFRKPAGCSSVRNGDFHGRNLDYFINHDADVVVHIKSSKDRYASVGMVSCFPALSKEKIDGGDMDENFYNLLPLFTVDGINEYGVAANINVLPTQQCQPTTGTNPNRPTLLVSCVVRFILDHAKSVDEAVNLLKEHNIVTFPASSFPFETHFMISDAQKTVVVEFWDNQIVVTPSNIMTNFYLCNDSCFEKIGTERFDILKAHYDEATTAEGMKNLMKRVWYSKGYTRETQPFWYSEFVTEKLVNEDIETGNLTEFDQVADAAIARYGSIEQQKKLRNGVDWYTTHTAIYNLKELTLTLTAQENDTEWHFNIGE
ncbi:MAG: linear amide C-N hydrolase [Bacteroidales bacterium]|nr:linear amide C-N hydrolase [Bacteroidales bacterium]